MAAWVAPLCLLALAATWGFTVTINEHEQRVWGFESFEQCEGVRARLALAQPEWQTERCSEDTYDA